MIDINNVQISVEWNKGLANEPEIVLSTDQVYSQMFKSATDPSGTNLIPVPQNPNLYICLYKAACGLVRYSLGSTENSLFFNHASPVSAVGPDGNALELYSTSSSRTSYINKILPKDLQCTDVLLSYFIFTRNDPPVKLPALVSLAVNNTMLRQIADRLCVEQGIHLLVVKSTTGDGARIVPSLHHAKLRTPYEEDAQSNKLLPSDLVVGTVLYMTEDNLSNYLSGKYPVA